MNPSSLRSTILVNISEHSPALTFNVYSANAVLTAEARMWFDRFAGPEAPAVADLVSNPAYGYYFVGGKRGRSQYSFMFTDRKKAALFKLTWA